MADAFGSLAALHCQLAAAGFVTIHTTHWGKERRNTSTERKCTALESTQGCFKTKQHIIILSVVFNFPQVVFFSGTGTGEAKLYLLVTLSLETQLLSFTLTSGGISVFTT